MTRRRVSDPARRVAFEALRAVTADDAYANLALAKLVEQRALNSRDAAFATELLAGTCRFLGSYDAILEAAAGRRLRSLQPAVVDLLRLGVHQLLAMRVPTHAAVAATVELGAATVGERVTGLLNAVLRKVAAKTFDEWVAQLSRGCSEIGALAIRTAHPEWVVEAYRQVLPADEVEPALAANNESPETTLAVRPGLATSAELLSRGARPRRFSPYAVGWSGNPADLEAVRAGRAGVQDEGSQLVALALGRAQSAPGWWLDLCAGPGGKSALLAGLAAQLGSSLLAAELSMHRAELVAGALRAFRAGQGSADRAAPSVIVADGTRPAWRAAGFSRVLADVPCSGLGALRRRPESRWRRQPADVEEMFGLQRALLHSAADATAPAGVLAYVTCSPVRRETVEVVHAVLAERNDLEVLDAATLLPEVADASLGSYLQLWPHRHGTDAMFAAYLRRRDSLDG